LLSKAKEVVTNCTKTMAIVLSTKSPYKEGTFHYANWCLVELFEVWKISERKKAEASNDKAKVVPETMPPRWMFKGIIACCLWGHNKLHKTESTDLKSSVFNDGKYATSFGQNVESRGAI
jgi:hypothetical protein